MISAGLQWPNASMAIDKTLNNQWVTAALEKAYTLPPTPRVPVGGSLSKFWWIL